MCERSRVVKLLKRLLCSQMEIDAISPSLLVRCLILDKSLSLFNPGFLIYEMVMVMLVIMMSASQIYSQSYMRNAKLRI